MNARNVSVGSVGEVLINASRQVWLAGLGAAVVTRDWAEREAGVAFRNLVREGTTVESRAMRVVGDRLETSFVHANSMWKRARSGVTTVVKAYADTAATIVRDTLPASLPRIAGQPARPAAKRKAAKPRKAAARKTAGRATKRMTKAAKRG
jgi:Poly(hydroxyalcanoate) granule associated protein (phasin)